MGAKVSESENDRLEREALETSEEEDEAEVAAKRKAELDEAKRLEEESRLERERGFKIIQPFAFQTKEVSQSVSRGH